MRIRIDLAYDGADFHGWAAQPGLRTVQGELTAALGRALRTEPPRVVCAGRTDAGVHARGQVAHCDVDPELLRRSAGRIDAPPPEALTRRLNGILDPDLRVHRITEVPTEFDARFAATWRRYAYRIADGPELSDPLRRHHVLWHRRRLDERAMNAAAMELVGLHDFAAFCKAREGATTIRTLQQLIWQRDADGVLVGTVVADAFCHSMVRAVVGCLIAIGEGRHPTTWAWDVLAAGERTPQVAVAPAHGLTLEEVGYPPSAELAARGEITRNKRDVGEVAPAAGKERP